MDTDQHKTTNALLALLLVLVIAGGALAAFAFYSSNGKAEAKEWRRDIECEHGASYYDC